MWDVKLAPGGLVDIEFVTQHAILRAAAGTPGTVQPGSLAAIRALAESGHLAAGAADMLTEALGLQLNLQQALRIAAGDTFEPDQASEGLKAWIAKHLGFKGFPALAEKLESVQQQVAEFRTRILGPLTTDQAAPGV
jgi:glutamate-ammonia-ligase adenylyltransferase